MMTVRTLVPTLDRVLSLNRELDRVFNRNFGNSTAWLPAMDVVERADAFVVTLDVPGMSHASIDLTFDTGALTSGTRTSPSTVSRTRSTWRSVRSGFRARRWVPTASTAIVFRPHSIAA